MSNQLEDDFHSPMSPRQESKTQNAKLSSSRPCIVLTTSRGLTAQLSLNCDDVR